MVAKTLFILFLLYMCGEHYLSALPYRVVLAAEKPTVLADGNRSPVDIEFTLTVHHSR